jgi:hypothetical protein
MQLLPQTFTQLTKNGVMEVPGLVLLLCWQLYIAIASGDCGCSLVLGDRLYRMQQIQFSGHF